MKEKFGDSIFISKTKFFLPSDEQITSELVNNRITQSQKEVTKKTPVAETEVKNKKIVILDDVYTTGSTAKECSKLLKSAGAKQIGIITIAKD